MNQVGRTVHNGSWVDVGKPDAYLEANLAVLDGRVPTPVDPWTRGARGPNRSWVGSGARIDGDIVHSIVGDGAVVPASARLVDSVVWDGVTVPSGRHSRCVIYDGGKVLSLD